MRVTALAGGIGAGKFLRGLLRAVRPEDVTVVVNTGDDVEMHGLHVSPDLDSVTYWLGEAMDRERGWGRHDETFRATEELRRFDPEQAWFNLGDLDLATHLYRTNLLRAGATLSEATAHVAGRFGLGSRILPMSDEPVATYVTGWSVLIASFAVGLTFAWKKIPVDTMVQEAIPDGYRGRVFAVYDVAYNLSRVAAAFLAIPLLNAFGEAWAVAIIGVVFILWSPVLPRWIGRIPELSIRFYEGGRAEENPRAVVWGGVEETVEVERRSLEEADGVRKTRFRLRMLDGTTIEVSKVEPDGAWTLERELE